MKISKKRLAGIIVKAIQEGSEEKFPCGDVEVDKIAENNGVTNYKILVHFYAEDNYDWVYFEMYIDGYRRMTANNFKGNNYSRIYFVADAMADAGSVVELIIRKADEYARNIRLDFEGK